VHAGAGRGIVERMIQDGEVLAISVGQPKTVEYDGRLVRTAIEKTPREGPVLLTRLGFTGDVQADPAVHGGPTRAAYAYPFEHYPVWEGFLGRAPLPFGQFGENLTTQGWTERDVHLGDVFALGRARVQVTTPRGPCFKLGIRTGAPDIVRAFTESGLLGFYLRVLEEGMVEAGDPIALLAADPSAVTMADYIAAQYALDAPRELIARVAAAHVVSPEARARLERRIQLLDRI